MNPAIHGTTLRPLRKEVSAPVHSPTLLLKEGGGHRGLTVRPSARATSSSCPLCGVRDGARAHTVSVCESVRESECV